MFALGAGWRGRATTMLAAALATGAVAVAAPAGATAGNLLATGHDFDYHCAGGQFAECEYLRIVVNQLREGSALPILAIDDGSEVKVALVNAGFSESEIQVANPDDAGAFDAVPFVGSEDVPRYSLIVTASDASCGGCDLGEEGEAHINARAADFATYFNHGGAILALAGAEQFGTYYGFLPLNVHATSVEAPFTVTPFGASLGVTEEMADCCASHNAFAISPSAPPPPFKALESDAAGNSETIEVKGGIGKEEEKGKEEETVPQPTVSAVSPGVGLTTGGETVTITGTGFKLASSVRFGAASASFAILSPTQISATVPPAGPGAVDVTVGSSGGVSTTSAADRFLYVLPSPGPSVRRLSVKKGPAAGGTSVVISGSGFVGVESVSFGANPASSYTVSSSSSITAVAPPGTSGFAAVVVVTPNGTSATTPHDLFRYGLPTVTGVSPRLGSVLGGEPLTVTGSGFATGSGHTSFYFGTSLAIDVHCATSSSCTMLTPARIRAGTVDVRAKAAGKRSRTSPEDLFTFGE